MESYTEQEFIDLVGKRDDVNFLAAAITPWHAIGIDAAIYQLINKGIILKGYIMIVSHAVTGTAIDEKNFHIDIGVDLKILVIKETSENTNFKDKLKIKCNKYWYYINKGNVTNLQSNLYWITPLKPSYDLIPQVAKVKKNYKIQVIITDEGLGSYLNTSFTWWRYSYLEGGLKAGMRAAWDLLVRDKFFLNRLKKRGQIKYNQLLSGKKKKWIINKQAVEAYRHIFSLVDYEEEFSYYSKAVIINSDVLYESGMLYHGIEVEIYEDICKEMNKRGIPVILKMHPREKKTERYDKLECYKEMKNAMAQENIFAKLKEKPYCVIGIMSTTLVSSKILFGIDGISINRLIDKNDLKDKNKFSPFNETFSDLVYIPNTMEELLNKIQEIKDKYESRC